jgi:UDP-N-acetylmuramoyl-L-alanyl-D-glutamate--2,6-diaminopimelate ligase
VSREKRLGELLSAIGTEADEASEVSVTGVCEDSRRVTSGDLFVAVSGTACDGADFARDAIARGAVAVVSERRVCIETPGFVVPDARRALAALSAAFYDHPTRSIHTVGVTGTNGKTTVCHWVAHLLGADRTTLVSTVTNADETSGRYAGLTTPPSPVVQCIAREAVDDGKTHLVLEASSIGLEQGRLDAIEFDVCAFTNLTHDHLDLHRNLVAYRTAKARLFRSLGPSGCAVVNVDESAADAMLDGCRGRSFRVSRRGEADLVAREIAEDKGGIRFRLVHGGRAAEVRFAAVGLHNVDNALVAAGVGICSGLDLGVVADRLSSAPAVPGRQAVYRDAAGRTAVVDFAHNPDALRSVLDALRPRYRRLAAVFGCPGASDREKRPLMGEIAGRLADVVILTEDNPKHDSPAKIAEEIALGVRRVGGRFEVCLDRAEAVRRAVERIGEGDCVLVAGKGHERVQLVGDERVPYSDAATLEALGFAQAGRR